MEQYEVAILYHPDLEIDLTKATDKIEKIFKEAGGKVAKTDSWGKRKLAYKIAKQDHAVYVFYTLDLSPENVGQVNDALRITDEVIRFLITKIDHKAIAKAEAAKSKRDARIAKNASANQSETQDKDEE